MGPISSSCKSELAAGKYTHYICICTSSISQDGLPVTVCWHVDALSLHIYLLYIVPRDVAPPFLLAGRQAGRQGDLVVTLPGRGGLYWAMYVAVRQIELGCTACRDVESL